MLTAALKSGAVRTYTLLTETTAFCGLFVFSVEFFLKNQTKIELNLSCSGRRGRRHLHVVEINRWELRLFVAKVSVFKNPPFKYKCIKLDCVLRMHDLTILMCPADQNYTQTETRSTWCVSEYWWQKGLSIFSTSFFLFLSLILFFC